jgi:hypothetical protein
MKLFEKEIPITKYDAAIGQLESAIFLWFNDGHPAAVHTLAVAADDCFNSLKKHRTKTPSAIQIGLKTLSKAVQDRFLESQRFFKHGDRELKKILRFFPVFTDIILMNAVVSQGSLGVGPTPFTLAFFLRFYTEHPDAAAPLMDLYGPLYKRFEVDPSEELSRPEFFEKHIARIKSLLIVPRPLEGPIL